jgi:hypothetical protein
MGQIVDSERGNKQYLNLGLSRGCSSEKTAKREADRGVGWSDHGRVHISGNRNSRGYIMGVEKLSSNWTPH